LSTRPALWRSSSSSDWPTATLEAHHYRIIQSLRYTLRSDDKLIMKLDAFRKKRNISEYDHAGSVTKTELDDMIDLASGLRKSAGEIATI